MTLIWHTHLFVPSTDHASHREAHASVTQHHVRQQLWRSGHRDPVVVPQPVEPAQNQQKICFFFQFIWMTVFYTRFKQCPVLSHILDIFISVKLLFWGHLTLHWQWKSLTLLINHIDWFNQSHWLKDMMTTDDNWSLSNKISGAELHLNCTTSGIPINILYNTMWSLLVKSMFNSNQGTVEEVRSLEHRMVITVNRYVLTFS